MQNAEPRSKPRPTVRSSQFAVHSLLLSAICYLLSAASCLRAAANAGEIDSLIKTAPAQLGSADALVLLDRVQVSFDAGSNRVLERHCLVKVFTAQGRSDYQPAGIPFDPATEKCEVRLAQVHAPDGKTTAIGNSLPIRFGDAPDGSVLEYQVRLSPRKKGRSAAFSGFEPLGGYVPVRRKELSVSFPKGTEFHWSCPQPPNPDPQSLLPDLRVDTTGKTVRFHWVARQESALVREPGEPGIERRVPAIIYSSYSTWREVAEGFRKRWAPALSQTTGLRQKAHQLALGKSRSEALREIFRFVGEEIQTAAAEPGAIGRPPQPAALVLKQGRGDCRDKAGLLAALLNAEGITASPLPIRSGGMPVAKEVPAPEAFDRVIVMAVLDNNAGYFDPCAGRQPYGRLPDVEQGAEGLVLDPKNYRFTTLPVESYDRNLAQVTGDITVRHDGLVTGVIKARLTGCYDAWARETLAGKPPGAGSQFAAALLALDNEASVVIDSLSISDLTDITKPVELSFRYTVFPLTPDPRSLTSVLLPAPALFLDPLFALSGPAARRTDLLVRPWRICRFTGLVHLESGVSASSLAATWFRETPSIRATRWWEKKPSGIEFKTEFMLKKTDLTPEDYQQVKAVADEFRAPGMRELRLSR